MFSPCRNQAMLESHLVTISQRTASYNSSIFYHIFLYDVNIEIPSMGINISPPKNGPFWVDVFPFPVWWDMLISWRVYDMDHVTSNNIFIETFCWSNDVTLQKNLENLGVPSKWRPHHLQDLRASFDERGLAVFPMKGKRGWRETPRKWWLRTFF